MNIEANWKRPVSAALLASILLAGPGAAWAQSNGSARRTTPRRGVSPTNGARKTTTDERLRALEAEIAELKRERAEAQHAADDSPAAQERAQASGEPPVGESQVKNIVDETIKKQKILAGWQDGFFLQSPSGDFKLKLRGYTQADGRFFPAHDGKTNNDSFYLRRVRPIWEGSVYKYFGFRIMPDFGGGQTLLQDAYLDVTYLPYASLRAGKFKEPFSLERLQSGAELLFIERSLAQNIAPNRDVGVQLFGNVGAGIFEYQLALTDGLQDGGSNDDNRNSDEDFAGRFFVQPGKGSGIPALESLGFGLAGTYGNRTDDSGAVNYRTAARASFYRYANSTVTGKGIQWRIAPQAYWFWGPFGLMGEFYDSESRVKGTVGSGDAAKAASAKENATGWFLQASWVLTGEDASFKMVSPVNNFDPLNGRWGAFEVASRVSSVNVDDDAIDAKLATGTDGAWAYTAGLNWYLNKNFKFQFNYERTDFDDKVTFSGEQRRHEDVLLTRFQLAF